MDTGESSFTASVSPEAFVDMQKEEQGFNPDAWARNLAHAVYGGILTPDQAVEYAAALEKAAEERGKGAEFRRTYDYFIDQYLIYNQA